MDEQVATTVWALTMWSVLIAVAVLLAVVLRGILTVTTSRDAFTDRLRREVPWGVFLLTIGALALLGPRVVFDRVYPGEIYTTTFGQALGQLVLIWIAAVGFYIGILLIAGHATDRLVARLEARRAQHP